MVHFRGHLTSASASATVPAAAPGAGSGASSSGGGGDQVLDVGTCGDRPKKLHQKIVSRTSWQRFFESNPYHNTVIALVLLDLTTVAIDLGFMLAHCPEPHLKEPVEEMLEAFTWISIGILSIFVLEFAGQVICFGFGWFKKPANALDVTVVVLSLILEIVLRQSELREVVALLIVFRLWRLVRVIHATEEILHIEHEKKGEAALEELAGTKKALEGATKELEGAKADLAGALRELEGVRRRLAAAEGAPA
ncbi:MAG: hypothetical protein J3K34DRAFT_463380 [Monoraphidium minutum]|nr:MAG: hypothetical protein J3K34DRAFT_463380 [Monoraphidium minutum]